MLCGFETPCFQIISDRKLGVRLFYFCLLCLSSASNKSRLSPIWRSYKTVMSFMASTKCGISNHHSSSHTFNRIMISIDLQMWNYKQPGWHHLCWIFFLHDWYVWIRFSLNPLQSCSINIHYKHRTKCSFGWVLQLCVCAFRRFYFQLVVNLNSLYLHSNLKRALVCKLVMPTEWLIGKHCALTRSKNQWVVRKLLVHGAFYCF